MRNIFKKKPVEEKKAPKVDFEKVYYTNPLDAKLRLETAVGALERTNLVLQNMIGAPMPESYSEKEKEDYKVAVSSTVLAVAKAAHAVEVAAEYIVEYHYVYVDQITGERVAS